MVVSGVAAGVVGDASVRDENAVSGISNNVIDGSTHNQSQFCAQCHGLVH